MTSKEFDTIKEGKIVIGKKRGALRVRVGKNVLYEVET